MTYDCRLERILPGPEREEYLSLLYPADQPEMIRGYLQAPEGDLVELRHADGEPLGVTFVLPHAGEVGRVELCAVTVDQTHHNQGLGREMLGPGAGRSLIARNVTGNRQYQQRLYRADSLLSESRIPSLAHRARLLHAREGLRPG